MNKRLTQIKFYGSNWCGDCRRARVFLDENKARYEYINLDENPDAVSVVEKINNGFKSIPTIVFPNGKVLVEPSNDELRKALIDNQDHIISNKTENIHNKGGE